MKKKTKNSDNQPKHGKSFKKNYRVKETKSMI